MTTATIPLVRGTSERLTAALAALTIGAVLVFLTGFAPVTALHNAAHDTRHAMSFPCH